VAHAVVAADIAGWAQLRHVLAAWVRTNPRCGAWETPEIVPRLEKGVDGCVSEHPCRGVGDLAFVDST
jgi:hypothetical protein